MSTETKDPIEVIAGEFGKAIQPLAAACSSSAALRDFFELLGWDLSAVPASLNALKAPAELALKVAEGSEEGQLADIQQLISAIKSIFQALSKLGNAGDLLPGMKGELPSQLLQFLLVEYLLGNQPGVGELFRSIGIIRLEEIDAQGARLAYQRRIFVFSEFADLFGDPLVFFKNAFKWGESDFRGGEWVEALAKLLEAWGLLPDIDFPGEKALNHLTKNSLNPDSDPVSFLKVYFFRTEDLSDEMSAGAGLFLLPETASAKPGFAVMPFVEGEFEESVEITGKLSFTIRTSAELAGGIGILVRPDKGIEVFTALDSDAPAVMNSSISLLFSLSGGSEPFILIGKKGASRIEVGGVSAEAGLRVTTKNYDLFTEFGIEKAKIAIKAEEGSDGFLAKILPAEGLSADFDLTLGFSTSKGIYFGASGGLEIELPLHLKLGPVEITSGLIALKVKDKKLNLESAVSMKGELGPLKVVVQNVGLATVITFPDGGDGNIGPVNLALKFRPPDGLGVSIDAGAVTGGGYLYFDTAKEEYAGVLELTIAGFISAKAIGLIATRMPDGSKGFSLLIIITAEFSPPFQLGYGFTLIGVGGLLGMNRTVLLQPLREGVRTGSVNSIMFPQNVVANSTKIISDLKSIFPVLEDRFLVGPMGKLGYGTPTLISLSFGLIIEIPGNIAILGVLKMVLPDEKAALIKIQVAFLGTIDFDNSMLTFDASLYESRILTMTLEGDMAVRLKWGDSPAFVITIGGFHPSFTPPPLSLPSLRRLAINILNVSAARIRIECYQAVTSNTVQFGAKAELYFGFSAISISGYISFDALFQFSPFYFIVQVSGSVSLKVFGAGVFSIRLQLSLEGPTPWRAKGKGSIKILFIKISANFDKTWGDSKDTSLPDIEVLDLLIEQIEGKEQWKASIGSGKTHLVTLRELEETTGSLIVHPSGTLTMMQKLLPLAVNIDKVGNQKTTDLKRVEISSAYSNGTELTVTSVNDSFARAQYQEMSDSEKLSKPSFEKLPAGVEISMGDESIKTGRMVRRKVEYEVIIVDKEPEKLPLLYMIPGILFNNFFRGGSVAASVLSKSHRDKLQPFPEKVVAAEEGYSVAYTDSNKVYSAAVSFTSEAVADDFLQEQIRSDPALKNQLHIVPNYELS